MSKEHRLLPKIVAGVLAIGGLSAIFEREPEKAKPEVQTSEEVVEEKELGPEADPKFCAEHPIEAELRKQNVPTEKMQSALSRAIEMVRSHRYGDSVNEKKYFRAVTDIERWPLIQQAIREASEKTGVPERILIGMGFMESQFDEQAERKDTHVAGTHGMTLDAAKFAIKNGSMECFGYMIDVTSLEDLKDFRKSIPVAALYVRVLKKEYGSFGLAIMSYAGTRREFEHHIKKLYPQIDFAEKEWAEMEKYHEAEREAKIIRDELMEKKHDGHATEEDRHTLRSAVATFEAAGVAYKKAHKEWKEKRHNLPRALEEAEVTAVTLFPTETERGKYVLALDDVAERAQKHLDEATSQSKKQKIAEATL